MGAGDTDNGGNRAPMNAWWRNAVGYEVYIRSFLDANGDGIGDLTGIAERLDYFSALGVDVIWITPFYPSPGMDHGYDVSDYTGVDPQFGSLADFEALVDAAHERGLRVFIDIVPNHSSDRHPWFQHAILDPTGPYRDYYLFRPPAPDGGPPNNWVSHFGGPAWTLDPAGSGEYYCHLFLPEQPDLNWANPAVMEEFRDILRTWCDRGIDGFRIDVAHGLTKDPMFLDNPQLRPIDPGMHPTDVFQSFQHVHDLHRAETTKIFREWREIVAPYGAVLLGEMDTRNIDRFREYVAAGDGLDLGFVLKLGSIEWEPTTIITDLLSYDQAASGGAAWTLSNHDQARVVSRFGGGDVGLRRAFAVNTIMVLLDGLPFLYQGEELGLPNAELVGASHDPVSTRNPGAIGRDVARGPMPWDSSHLNGFSTAPRSWLETAELPTALTAVAQVEVPGSAWDRYRALVSLRRRFPDMTTEPMRVAERTDTELMLVRGATTLVANLGVDHREFVLEGEHDIVFESAPGAAQQNGVRLLLEPESSVVMRSYGVGP